jgi:hypothetical protein
LAKSSCGNPSTSQIWKQKITNGIHENQLVFVNFSDIKILGEFFQQNSKTTQIYIQKQNSP